MQHRAWTVPLHPTTYAEHEAGPAEGTDFKVSDITGPGIEPSLPALVARAQSTVPLNQFYENNYSV